MLHSLQYHGNQCLNVQQFNNGNRASAVLIATVSSVLIIADMFKPLIYDIVPSNIHGDTFVNIIQNILDNRSVSVDVISDPWSALVQYELIPCDTTAVMPTVSSSISAHKWCYMTPYGIDYDDYWKSTFLPSTEPVLSLWITPWPPPWFSHSQPDPHDGYQPGYYCDSDGTQPGVMCHNIGIIQNLPTSRLCHEPVSAYLTNYKSVFISLVYHNFSNNSKGKVVSINITDESGVIRDDDVSLNIQVPQSPPLLSVEMNHCGSATEDDLAIYDPRPDQVIDVQAIANISSRMKIMHQVWRGQHSCLVPDTSEVMLCYYNGNVCPESRALDHIQLLVVLSGINCFNKSDQTDATDGAWSKADLMMCIPMTGRYSHWWISVTTVAGSIPGAGEDCCYSSHVGSHLYPSSDYVQCSSSHSPSDIHSKRLLRRDNK